MKSLPLLLFLTLGYFSLPAQVPIYWGNIQSGPYQVGFKVIYLTDSSRIYRPEQDLSGKRNQTFYRPIRIYLWYPAKPEANAKPMRYGEYLIDRSPNDQIAAWNRLKLKRDSSLMQVTYATGDKIFAQLTHSPSHSFYSPQPLDEKFPLIIHSLGTNSYSLESTPMWEMLASNGYAVATIPQFNSPWPSLSIGGVNDRASQENQIRDLEFSISKLSNLEFINESEIGAIGFSGGGLYAFLAGMKNPGLIDALVSLDGSITYKHVKQIKDYYYYHPYKVNFAILNLHKESSNLDYEILDSLVGADRWYVDLGQAYHMDFTQLPLVNSLDPESEGYYDNEDERKFGVEVYETASRYVLNFFNAYLKKDPGGLAFLRDSTTLKNSLKRVDLAVKFLEGIPVPAEEDIVAIIHDYDLETAVALATKVRDKTAYDLNKLLWWANVDFSYHKKYDKAIELYQFINFYAPENAEPYYFMGNTFLKMDQPVEARKAYLSGLEILNSSSRDTKENRDLEKKFRAKIQELDDE